MGVLKILAVAALAWSVPALAQQAAPERAYILRDNGIRCVRAPCPSMTATEVATRQGTAVTGVDLSGLGLSDEQRATLSSDLYAGRLVVLGRIRRDGEGTIFVVSRALRRAPGAPAPRTRLPLP